MGVGGLKVPLEILWFSLNTFSKWLQSSWRVAFNQDESQ